MQRRAHFARVAPRHVRTLSFRGVGLQPAFARERAVCPYLSTRVARSAICPYAGHVLTVEQLAEILERNPGAAQARVREFAIGGCGFAFNSKKAILGVINLSPDSWYRESVCLTVESAVRRGRILHEQGAAIVDVGAESTLAHAARSDETAQTSRLLPVIKELRAAGILVSV